MKLLQKAEFHIGQVIRHRLFNYRGGGGGRRPDIFG